MELKKGMKVRVAFDPSYMIFDGSRRFEGLETEISKKRIIREQQLQGVRLHGHYYELEGAESDTHIPYGFLEQNLIPIID